MSAKVPVPLVTAPPKTPPAKPVRASMSRKEMRQSTGFETDSYAYDFRTRNNLKQNRG